MNRKTFDLTAMATAVALAAGTLAALPAWAQQYDVATIQTYDLGKSAADRGSRDKRPTAPIAARPNGGAYIQWAHQTDWNSGNRTANSRVFVTEVNSTGGVVGTDIELGRSQPGGLSATSNSFGYLLMDGHKLTFKVHGGGETLVMDHLDKGAKPPVTTFRRGFRPDQPSVYSPLKGAYGFAVPYDPIRNDRGGVAFGNNAFSTAFAISNNYQPSGEQSRDPSNLSQPGPAWNNPDDAHQGDAYIFFDGNGTAPKLGGAKGDHSWYQRVVFDASNNTFPIMSYAHGKMNYTVHDSQGQRAAWGTANPLNDLTDNGHLGDLHPLGDGTVGLSYGIAPRLKGTVNDTRNMVGYFQLDSTGNVTQSKNLFTPESRANQGNYTAVNPYERVRWIKSAQVGSAANLRIQIFFQTETWDGGPERDAYNRRIYTPSTVRMVQVDAQGNVQQPLVTMPANKAKFNFGDPVVALSNGTLAWTHTGDGTLKLSLLAPPNLVTSLPKPPAAPTASSATAVTTVGFTASWTAVNRADSYRLDVSTDNFQTFVVQDQTVTGTSYELGTLNPGTTFQYRVRSFNNAGGGDNSNVITAQTNARPTLPPMAPACNPTGKPYAGFVTIKKFTIFDVNGGVHFAPQQTNNGNTTYEDFTGSGPVFRTTPGASYTYAIDVYHSPIGSSIWIDRNGDGSFRDANGNHDVSEQVVYNQSHPKTSAPLTIPADLPLGAYRMRVVRKGHWANHACAPDGAGQMEDYVLEVVAPGSSGGTATPPATTQAPAAGDATSVAANGFTANWNAVAGATGYRLDVSTDSFQTFVVQNQAVTATSYPVSGLQTGTSYRYRVRAVAATGTSSDSNAVNVQTLAGSTQPPSAQPTASPATAIEEYEFTANWTAVSGATGYLLDLSEDGFQTFEVQSLAVQGTTVIVDELEPDTPYSYRVRAVLASGPSAYSNQVDVRTGAEL